MIDGLRIGTGFQARSCQPESAANEELAGQLLLCLKKNKRKAGFSVVWEKS